MSGIKIVKILATTVAMLFAAVGSGYADSTIAASVYKKAITLKPDLENGKEVYAICASCHLQEGWGLEDGTYPQIAGQYRLVLIQQLADIHAHNRDNPTMYPFALPEAIGDAQDISDVAGYIEKMKMSPDNGKGEWAEGAPEFEKGKKLFANHCAECHGENGEGDPNKLYPRIHGQHYKYLLRQLEWMRDGKRRSVKHDMLKNINSFPAADIAQVANYASRLPVQRQEMSE
jgi:cytochrome c553